MEKSHSTEWTEVSEKESGFVGVLTELEVGSWKSRIKLIASSRLEGCWMREDGSWELEALSKFRKIRNSLLDKEGCWMLDEG
ncbi:MAG: hypothetical protein ACQETL_17865 [Bacteroidota bacterium]